jgi:hypothetical protein
LPAHKSLYSTWVYLLLGYSCFEVQATAPWTSRGCDYGSGLETNGDLRQCSGNRAWSLGIQN